MCRSVHIANLRLVDRLLTVDRRLMALSFKYSTGTMACLFSLVQEQTNSVAIGLLVNGKRFGPSFISHGLAGKKPKATTKMTLTSHQ